MLTSAGELNVEESQWRKHWQRVRRRALHLCMPMDPKPLRSLVSDCMRTPVSVCFRTSGMDEMVDNDYVGRLPKTVFAGALNHENCYSSHPVA